MRPLGRVGVISRHATGPAAATAASLQRRTMETLHFDVITIGSGGGAKVSTPAHNLGFRVAMLEHGFDVRLPDDVRAAEVHKDGLGGTCLNRGCIPSKMLIHPADVVTEIKEASRFDLKVSFDGVDMDRLVS